MKHSTLTHTALWFNLLLLGCLLATLFVGCGLVLLGRADKPAKPGIGHGRHQVIEVHQI